MRTMLGRCVEVTVVGVVMVLGALAPSTGRAQAPLRRLARSDAEHREPFTSISGLRELSDGRVLVADVREKTLQLIDLSRGTSRAVGRQGAGPGEWGSVSELVALPGDTTMMIDVANGRVFLVGPDGTPAPPVRMAENSPLLWSQLVGADAAGRLLLVKSRAPSTPTAGSVGTADVMRLDRRSARVDTVATLAEPKGELTAARILGGGMMQLVTNLPFASRDLAAIAPDGRIALVRSAPYRVEWIAPDGTRREGAVAASPNIPVTAAEKADFARRSVRPGGILIRRGPAAPPQKEGAGATPQPRTPTMSKLDVEKLFTPDQEWPAVKPPFLDAAVRVAPDGRVWVQRTRAWDDSIPTFDVFDAAGRVVERVALPRRTRLVGFGTKSLYLARTDDDDLVWLQRVPR
ncbi:MAG: hypothetical protein IT359_18500 [Gemmatimonadaceae bacterium]|nr:hypothetical protein [Gemmatimonadaceae bacterium]